MASLSEFVIAACELVEAQAYEIKGAFFKSGVKLILYFVCACLVVLGFVFLSLGIYTALKSIFSQTVALFVVSVVVFLFAFVLFLVAKWKSQI
ncbi:MAG: hypothetical protein MR902_00105 [Campylobacter sp.]|nr:hypothetical protein [Campylobacter sp.]